MWNRNQDSGSEAGDIEKAEQKFLPSYVIVAVDCHASMFVPAQDGVLPFRHCLQACFELADALVLEPRWSPFAVVLARHFFLKCKKVFHDVTSGYFRRILQFVTNDSDPVLDKTEKYQSINELKTFPSTVVDKTILLL